MPRGADMQYIFSQVPSESGPDQQPPGAPAAPQPYTAPESPSPAQTPGTSRLHKFGPGQPKRMILIAIMAAVVIIAAAAIYAGLAVHHVTTTTTTAPVVSKYSISSCGAISTPGNYTFSGNVHTGITSGTCINVSSSDVSLNCMGYSLSGSGPYSGVGPFTYGIMLSGNSAKLTDCKVSNFSYGVYAGQVSGLSVHNDNLSYNYMSDLYLSNAQNASVHNDIFMFSTSSEGALHVGRGSTNNRIYNNTVNNQFGNGIVINSTGNTFFDNYASGSPSGLYCSAYSGTPRGNNAYGNRCFNSTGCSFAQCSGFNKPPNLSQISLSKSVSSCGSINSPGAYTLQGPVNMAQYMNVSNPASSGFGVSCIYIKSNKVTLNCAGNPILNATTAIFVSGVSNITVSNCRLQESEYGIVLGSVNGSRVYNITANGGIAGVQLNGSNIDSLTNITADGNDYGIYLQNSTSDTINRFVTLNNSYGIYLLDSFGDIFSNGKALNNSVIDVYASTNSASSSDNFMSTTNCGTTNAQWANCKKYISTSLQYVPVDACGGISSSGNYILTTPLLTTSNACITIRSDNVRFSCQGNHIGSSIATSQGYAISVNGSRNVTIDGCDLANFMYAIVASNSTDVTVKNITDYHSGYGVALYGVNRSTVSSNLFQNDSYYGISLVGSFNNSIEYNNISYVFGPGAAIRLNGSRGNMLGGNIGYASYDGMSLEGASQNNTILNNTMYSSANYDYACSPQNYAIDAENGGVNTGASKLGCRWLAAIPEGYTGMNCIASFAPNYLSFSTDQVYRTGSTCFTVYGNSTTLDCNGHTVIATNGGTLMALNTNNSKSVSVIKDCVLKGFTKVISARKTQFSLINDTIYSNATSARPGVPIVNLTGDTNVQISYNNISTPYYALYISNTSIGTMNNNFINGGTVSYALYNVSGLNVRYNKAGAQSGIGLIMNNSVDESFQDNNFTGVALGIQCTGRSAVASASTDLGGNSCSSQFQCAWINQSRTTCS